MLERILPVVHLVVIDMLGRILPVVHLAVIDMLERILPVFHLAFIGIVIRVEAYVCNDAKRSARQLIQMFIGNDVVY